MTARYVARVGVLLALALIVPMLGLPQPITGPAVNAVLLVAAIEVGPVGGASIGLLTPWIALLRGQLAAPLAPAVPFIMLGNAIIVLVYWLVARLTRSSTLGWGSWMGVVLGAVAKYLVISGAVKLLLHLPPKLAIAMGTPQLVTALIGGAAALLVARALQAAGVAPHGTTSVTAAR